MSENVEKSEFLSGISHEIRTVLNTIVGLSEDINGYEDIPEEISKEAEDLLVTSKKLLKLVEKIIDFSKIESNEMTIVNGPYKPKALFEELAKINELNIQDKPVTLHTSIDQNLPYELFGDGEHIEEIVDNLLNNAIKFTDGGDIWFDVKGIYDNDNCLLTISVKDTGCGMTQEEIKNIFSNSQLIKNEIDINKKEMGLGLSIAKSLSDLMNGKFNVESTYGEGSKFTFSINQKIINLVEPELDKTQRLQLDQINFDNDGYGYKKVLIVDDNTLNIKVVRRILEQSDLVIDECYNGEECLDIIKENNDYDVILMDILMPVMSGEETLKRLKQIDGFNTPVIALTADVVEGAEQKYEQEGFVDYIAKPFSKIQIKKKLDIILKKKELSDKDII
jgi:CheY-like chemotaxis protein